MKPKKDDYYRLHPRVKAAYLNHGSGYEWGAEVLGVHKITIAKWLNRKYRAPASKIIQLGKILAMRPDEMVMHSWESNSEVLINDPRQLDFTEANAHHRW